MNKKSKFIFVIGGVLSGLGKGVTAASVGRVLKSKGFKLFVQKFDPYYNVDPGTMNPYEHGEVYVTKDGAEGDLDLGHYERFIGIHTTKESTHTQGKILNELLEEERQGKYGGKTIQVVPHLMNKIIETFEKAADSSNADFVISEIGGTVGDLESNVFLEAISRFKSIYPNRVFVVHVTYMPFLGASQEFKSKPTQHSIDALKSRGLNANMLILRSDKPLDEQVAKKVAIKTYMDPNYVFPIHNTSNIFALPLLFDKQGVADRILDFFNIKPKQSNLSDWRKYVSLVDAPKTKTLNIAMIGKYVEYEDAYKSIIEAIKTAGYWNKVDVKLKWIQADKLNETNIASKVKNQDGAIILPGFGKRGFEGKVAAAKYLRDKNIPTLGICFGLQAMVVDQAKRRGIHDATSSEIKDDGTFVIDIIRGKSIDDDFGGTLRLGESTTLLKEKTIAQKLYKSDVALERHRHRYEVNPQFVSAIEDDNFIFSGFDKETKLAEVCELSNHPFYVGVQAHPEFNSDPLNSHPLFLGFIKAIVKK